MSKKATSGQGGLFRVGAGGAAEAVATGAWSAVAAAVGGRPQVMVALVARGAKNELALMSFEAWAPAPKPRVTALEGASLSGGRLFTPAGLALQP